MIVLFLSVALAEPPPLTSQYAEVMTTKITVALPPEQAEHAAEVFEAFRQVEATANEWKSDSPLGAVNAAAGEASVAIPDDLRGLLNRGVELGKLTDGAFDITWGSLRGLWDFNAEHPTVPSSEERVRRIALIDYRKVTIDDKAGTASLPEKGMVIGLGGIAKGHALNLAAAALERKGVTDFSISAGGQVLVRGSRGDRPWRVGIRDPRSTAEDYFAVVEATDQSVSTSGDYEHFFLVDGVRYHHILDPKTGAPARGLRSATVISADATTADALSTAVMVLGGQRGLALIERTASTEAVLVDDLGGVHKTSGARLIMVHSPAPD